MKKNSSFLMFLVGVFSLTEIHVVGYISISEFAMFLIAPFLFLKNLSLLKREGFMPLLWLTILTMVGCVIASWANHTAIPLALRGLAAIYAIFVSVVCLHALLRKDFDALKWIVLGHCCSLIVNIFIFQRGSFRSGGEMGAEAMDATMGYVLFWTTRIKAWLYLPIEGWYLSVPKFYAVPAAFAVVIMGLFFSGGSGRSAAIAALVSCFFLFIGADKRRGIEFIKKNKVTIFIALALLGLCFKFAYTELASAGKLGDGAAKKYEQQTKRGSSVLALLMGGRVAFFSGAYSCLCKPIIGYGPWAEDTNGIFGEFLVKYGQDEDYDSWFRTFAYRQRIGKRNLLSSHSQIITFWMWYGIFGLILWLYVLYLVAGTFFKTLSLYPPWFGYFACVVPAYVWNVFFSPFGDRIMVSLLMVMCLLLRAVQQRKLLPFEEMRMGRGVG